MAGDVDMAFAYILESVILNGHAAIFHLLNRSSVAPGIARVRSHRPNTTLVVIQKAKNRSFGKPRHILIAEPHMTDRAKPASTLTPAVHEEQQSAE